VVHNVFAGKKEVQERVNKLLEGDPALVLVGDIQEDDAFGSSLRDVLVLALLRRRQV